jgi:hypothetical protein
MHRRVSIVETTLSQMPTSFIDPVCMGGSYLPLKDGMETDDLQVTCVGAVEGESGDFLARIFIVGGTFGGAAGLCCVIGAYWYFFRRQKTELTRRLGRNQTSESWDKYCKSLSLKDLLESQGTSAEKLYYRNTTTTRIERVQTEMQHDTYEVQKKHIAKDITKTTAPADADRFARWLFQGTDAQYSQNYTERKNDELTRQIQRKMLLNRAIVGEWFKGAPEIKDVPWAKEYRQY